MALSTEQVIETVSKITGLPHGLFKEQVPPRTRCGLTNFVFDCDAESDEYSILVNAKDEIIEIKNAYNTWGQAMISIALNPPPPLPQRPDPSNNVITTGAFQAQPYIPPPTFTNMPAQPSPIMPTTFFDNIKQYASDFVKLNPGCITSLFDPTAIINEASMHNYSAWSFNDIHNDGTEMEVYLNADGSSDQSIADQVTAALTIDIATGNVTKVSIEG